MVNEIPQSIEDFIAVHLRGQSKSYVIGELYFLKRELSQQLENVKKILDSDFGFKNAANAFYWQSDSSKKYRRVGRTAREADPTIANAQPPVRSPLPEATPKPATTTPVIHTTSTKSSTATTTADITTPITTTTSCTAAANISSFTIPDTPINSLPKTSAELFGSDADFSDTEVANTNKYCSQRPLSMPIIVNSPPQTTANQTPNVTTITPTIPRTEPTIPTSAPNIPLIPIVSSSMVSDPRTTKPINWATCWANGGDFDQRNPSQRVVGRDKAFVQASANSKHSHHLHNSYSKRCKPYDPIEEQVAQLKRQLADLEETAHIQSYYTFS